MIDQQAKLRYLLDHRLDQRPENPARPGFALGEDNARLVTDQATLADAVGASTVEVSRWLNHGKHIHLRYVNRLVEIFALQFRSFTEDSYADFTAICRRGRYADPSGPNWRLVTHSADERLGRIVLAPPTAPAPMRRRFPKLPEMSGRPPKQRVAINRAFWIEFASLPAKNGRPLWQGWPMFIFSHDTRRQEFKCYIPALGHLPNFELHQFPQGASALYLPLHAGFTHEKEDIGVWEMILIVSHAEFPPGVRDYFKDPDAHGAAIEHGLGQLAVWLNDRPANSIGAAKVVYRVTSSTG